MSMHLARPSILYKNSFLRQSAAITAEGRLRYLQQPLTTENFEHLLQTLFDFEQLDKIPKGNVPMSVYWLVEGEEFLGNLNLRHCLNGELLYMGGHIGYFIAPEHRRKGYGCKILELGLQEAKNRGLEKVLITCDKQNEASAKIIERNGGVYENEVWWEPSNDYKKRYWIQLTA